MLECKSLSDDTSVPPPPLCAAAARRPRPAGRVCCAVLCGDTVLWRERPASRPPARPLPGADAATITPAATAAAAAAVNSWRWRWHGWRRQCSSGLLARHRDPRRRTSRLPRASHSVRERRCMQGGAGVFPATLEKRAGQLATALGCQSPAQQSQPPDQLALTPPTLWAR
jgi:hypothetical protein